MSIVKRLGGSSAAKVRHLFGLCKEFEEKMCKVSAKKQIYLFFLPSRSHFYAKNVQGECKKANLLVFLPSRSHFYAKSVEMEVVFNRCWMFRVMGTGHEVNPKSWTQHLLFICEEEH